MIDFCKLLQVVDATRHCWTPDHAARKLSAVDTIILHRISEGRSAQEVAEWFAVAHEQSLPGVSSPLMPYHFLIRRCGLTEQALPLSAKGVHAANYNSRSIGIAVVGDFRNHRPTDAQRAHLAVLCRRLCDYFGKVLRIMGHTDLPNATLTPGKVCPGEHLSSATFRNYMVDTGSFLRE